MRIIGEVPHPLYKISIFYMNQKYIVKFEYGRLEQLYKFDEKEFIIQTLDDIKRAVNEPMLQKVEAAFKLMIEGFGEAAHEL